MFLGTARRWWITMGTLVVLGFGLMVADIGGRLGNVAGFLLLMAGIGVFAAAPMRYGDSARRSRREATAAPAAPAARSAATPARPVAPPYQPAQKIEAGDPSEV